jgi:hypothetical protein
MKNLKPGDIVKYSRNWLRSAGIFTGEIPFASGRIVAIEPLGKCTDSNIATIEWSIEGLPARVLTANLIRADKLHLEPN